jgi:hypothetical protein
MVGKLWMVNEDGNTTVIVLPATNAPDAPDVNPTVQVVPVAWAAWDEPTKVTVEVITTLAAGDAATASAVVATENALARYVPATGLVIPPMLRVAFVLSASPSVPCNVITTTPEEAAAVAPPVPLKPVNRVMVGVPVIVNTEGNVTVIVSPATRRPDALEVKPIDQVVPVASAASDEPANATAEAEAADAGSAVRVAPKPPASRPSTRVTADILVTRRRRWNRRIVLLNLAPAGFFIVGSSDSHHRLVGSVVGMSEIDS